MAARTAAARSPRLRGIAGARAPHRPSSQGRARHQHTSHQRAPVQGARTRLAPEFPASNTARTSSRIAPRASASRTRTQKSLRATASENASDMPLPRKKHRTFMHIDERETPRYRRIHLQSRSFAARFAMTYPITDSHLSGLRDELRTLNRTSSRLEEELRSLRKSHD